MQESILLVLTYLEGHHGRGALLERISNLDHFLTVGFLLLGLH